MQITIARSESLSEYALLLVTYRLLANRIASPAPFGVTASMKMRCLPGI